MVKETRIPIFRKDGLNIPTWSVRWIVRLTSTLCSAVEYYVVFDIVSKRWSNEVFDIVSKSWSDEWYKNIKWGRLNIWSNVPNIQTDLFTHRLLHSFFNLRSCLTMNTCSMNLSHFFTVLSVSHIGNFRLKFNWRTGGHCVERNHHSRTSCLHQTPCSFVSSMSPTYWYRPIIAKR